MFEAMLNVEISLVYLNYWHRGKVVQLKSRRNALYLFFVIFNGWILQNQNQQWIDAMKVMHIYPKPYCIPLCHRAPSLSLLQWVTHTCPHPAVNTVQNGETSPQQIHNCKCKDVNKKWASHVLQYVTLIM